MMKKLNPFYGLLPHSDIASDNPLFVQGIRRVTWWRTGFDLVEYSLWICGLWAIAILVVANIYFWITAEIRMANLHRYVPRIPQGYVDFWQGFLVFSLLAGALLDFAILSATLTRLVRNRNSLIGDLLHLTNLTGKTVTQAYHALARIHTWHWLLIVVAVRVVALLLYSFDVCCSGMPFEDKNETLIGLHVFGFLIIEPFWRARLITALALPISLRFSDVFSALLGGFAIELMLVTIPHYLFVRFFTAMIEVWVYIANPYRILAELTVVALMIYIAYFSLENVALERAEQHMFREGRD